MQADLMLADDMRGTEVLPLDVGVFWGNAPGSIEQALENRFPVARSKTGYVIERHGFGFEKAPAIINAAPAVMAMSATLNAGQCMPRQ